MLKYLKYLAILPPIAAFTVLVLNLLELNVLPTKYVILIIVILALLLAGIFALLTRRHLAPQLIAYLVALICTIAAAFASYYLIVVNQTINDFASTSIVTSDQTNDVDITSRPFTVLVSGLDASGTGNIDGGALSDVNQLITVDPVEHKILIVNTPRDYYVYLHGITEMRDKLTHAGYYGIDMTRQTLEDLYNIDIDYYVRINFETLTQLVDIIGGIDVESDYSFTTSSGTQVHQGWNHFNGKEALAFARERKSFGTGDTQRAADQQLVMIAIFEKITHSTTLLNNFADILNTLKDSFRTDLPIADLKKLVKVQLDEMPSWNIETTAVTGDAIYTTEVYSLNDGKEYYVSVPNLDSVAAARERILTILDLSSD